jgi:hypothetical protein
LVRGKFGVGANEGSFGDERLAEDVGRAYGQADAAANAGVLV